MSNLLPEIDIVRPASPEQAVAALSRPGAAALAGGTDLIVNLRRGIGAPRQLVDLTALPGIDRIVADGDSLVIGAGVRLAALAASAELGPAEAALREAALAVAGPSHRNLATVGGNLCLDTRCIYYNQSDWWRRANGYCLKYRGEICHVAPQGRRCRAAFSGDLAPALMVLGAEVEIIGPQGPRRMPLGALYREDGAAHLTLRPGEIVLRVHLRRQAGVSGYAKIRTRAAMEFPLAGVAAACRPAADGDGGEPARELAVALTGTNSCPLLLAPRLLPAARDDSFFAALQRDVQKAVSPQRTTALAAHYRRLAVAAEAVRLVRRLADG
ncbi:MAG: xanthine dehydrogenase family protein subunit M [Roseovarius sp.]